MKRTANPCGAQSVDFVGNHEEHSESVWGLSVIIPEKHEEHIKSVWGAICEFREVA